MNLIVLMLLVMVLMAGFGGTGWAQYNPDASGPPENEVPTPVTPKATPAKLAGKPAKLEHIQKAQAEGIMGETVVDAKGQAIGQIVDVLINAQGTPHAAVIQFAGFLGVGNRNIAVEWKALDFKVVKNQIVVSLDLDAAKLKAMPTYKTDAKSVPVAAPAKPKPVSAKPETATPRAAKPDSATPDAKHQGAASPAGAR